MRERSFSPAAVGLTAALLATAHCAHAPATERAAGSPTAPPPPAAAGPQPTATALPAVKIEEARLDNGLKLLVLEDHSAPVVTVQVWYRAGSRNERPGIRGIAHLVEHMMFKGSENVGPEQHARIIDAAGGRENAFTSEDVTAYHETLPSSRLALALELEAERMARAKLEQSHFFKEREVVKEEVRMRLQNDPLGTLEERFRALAFTAHPYQWTVGGTLEDLDRIELEDVKQFYRTYYAPNNAVLVVVGDTSMAAVLEQAKKHFGPIPAQAPPPEVSAVEPEQTAPRRAEVKLPTQMPMMLAGYKTPAASSEDTLVLQVIADILGGGQSSRLNRALVREKRLAALVFADAEPNRDPGLFMVGAAFLPADAASDRSDLETALLESVDRLVRQGATAEELRKAKNQLGASHVSGLSEIWGVGVAIGKAECVERDYRRFIDRLNAVERVTLDDVKRVGSRYLTRERLTVTALVPTAAGDKFKRPAATRIKEAERETAEWPTAERFLRLPAAEPDPIALPRITHHELDNDLKLLIVERHELPLVHLRLLLPGGEMLSRAGKAGSAGLMAQLLTQGTAARSAEQIAQLVDGLGGSLVGSAGVEHIALEGRFLRRDLDQGLDLFADVLLHPTFPVEELERARPQALSEVRRARDVPHALVFEHLGYLIYGYEHARGRPRSLRTLQAITRQDVIDLYREAVRPQGSILAVTGDVDPKQVIAALERALGGWQVAGEPFSYPKDPEPRGERRLRLVDKPDLTQTTIAIGGLGISYRDPDLYAVELGNFVLGGGGFSSRLMQSIRAKGGKSYTVRSRFEAGRTAGPFSAFTFTRNSEVGATAGLLLGEIEKLRAEGVTEAELQAAKNKLAGSFVVDLQPAAGMGRALQAAEFYGLGERHVRDYRKRITAPSVAEVNAALKKHLDPEALALVFVGRASEIAKQIDCYGKPVKVDFTASAPDEERDQEPAK
ncbi:MAG: insulinase family protein [Deltaproteobacteria bacterium]|nr:insulinase family protein [Deltaproteobacteria bacterium]